MARPIPDLIVGRGNIARFTLLLVVLVLLGCGSQEDIRHYKVPKPEVLYAQNHVEPNKANNQTAGQPTAPTDRLLGAIVPRGEQTWFFKMTGPINLVKQQEPSFRKLIESLTFAGADATPTWTLPPSWKQEKGSGLRQATLSVDVEGKKLEVSVFRLATSPSPTAVLDNVNRWRRQMQLPPIGPMQMEKQTETLALSEGTAILVDMLGNFSSGSMSSTSLAKPTPVPKVQPSSPASSQASQAKLKYETPKGWTPSGSVAFSVLAFELSDGNRSAQITVSPLGGNGGGLLMNVNRWYRQAGLPPINESDLGKKTEQLDVSGIHGDYVEVFGDARAIVGWIGTHDNKTWFVKISGTPQLVREQRETFRNFLKTLKFQAP